jgi:hypothetical protein
VRVLHPHPRRQHCPCISSSCIASVIIIHGTTIITL